MDSTNFAALASLSAASALSNLRILIVDDDPDTVTLFSMTFEQVGSITMFATSVDEALTLLEQHQPNMLVSDIQLPHKSGYDLIRQVRALEANGRAKTPAIAVTAHAKEDDRNQAIEAGFDRYLTKPVDLDTLIDTVAELAQCASLDGLLAD